jgi:hypothetical protein
VRGRGGLEEHQIFSRLLIAQHRTIFLTQSQYLGDLLQIPINQNIYKFVSKMIYLHFLNERARQLRD